jgi:hypothetical protein
MKAKIKIITTAQITALALLLGVLGSSFASGPSKVSPDQALKRLLQGNPVENAVRAQALDVAKQLQEAEPILAERVQSGKLKIVAARYDLGTGQIDLLTR